jgi:hypothetical protein
MPESVSAIACSWLEGLSTRTNVENVATNRSVSITKLAFRLIKR